MTLETKCSSGQRALLRFLERQGVLSAPPAVPGPEGSITNQELFEVIESVIGQAQLAELLASKLHLPLVDVAGRELDGDTIGLLQPGLATRCEVVPVGAREGTIELAMANPLDLEAVKMVEFASSRRVRLFVATHEGIRRALARHYGAEPPAAAASAAARPEPAGGVPPNADGPGTEPAPPEARDVTVSAAEPAAAGPEGPPPEPERPARILVVGADLARRACARSVLESAGLDCLIATARDAGEALAIATLDPPDVIVIDATGTAADGLGLCRRLREDPRTATVRVVRLVHRGEAPRAVDAAGLEVQVEEARIKAELAARVRSLVAGTARS